MVDGSWDFLETLESHASVIAAALWALRDGPNLAWDSGINNLDVEMDVLLALHLQKDQSGKYSPLAISYMGNTCNEL